MHSSSLLLVDVCTLLDYVCSTMKRRDPDIERLKAWAARNGGINSIPTIMIETGLPFRSVEKMLKDRYSSEMREVTRRAIISFVASRETASSVENAAAN